MLSVGSPLGDGSCAPVRDAVRVLVACEYSGAVRDAFRAIGHDAVSCDLLPTESPGPHVVGDVISLLDRAWDLVIAHPPCTFLCNSGVRWLYKSSSSGLPIRWLDKAGDRWQRMREAARFFRLLLDAPAPLVAVENPIMHRYAAELVGRRQDQIIQPWMFGHGETKATGLWLKGLSPLRPTNIVSGRVNRIHRLPPSPDRWKERSRTYKGIAAAMAEQWGGK